MTDLTNLNYNDIIGTCNKLTTFCVQHEAIITDATNINAKEFHANLPKILAEIMGSRTKRGWLHLALQPKEDTAIYKLLEPSGPFFACIQKMQYQSQFAYEILPNNLPASTQAFFKPSTYHLLPPVYADRIQPYSPEQMLYTTNRSPLYPSRQLSSPNAAIYRRMVGTAGPSDVKLTFSAYEFFIFNLLHGAIWNTYKPEVLKPPQHMTFPTQPFGPPRPTAATPSRPPPPQPKSMTETMYAPLLEEYIAWALPSSAGGMNASKPESSFFFQAAAEVWMSETVPTVVQRIPDEVLFCVSAVSRAVMQQDLRKCASIRTFHPNADVISAAHIALKDCAYIWLKGALTNAPLDDSFLQIVNIWSIWTAPWRFGNPARSEADDDTKPIDEGWGLYIAQNFLFYQPLVQLLLLRAARFGYADVSPKYQYNVRSVATAYRDNGTVRGEVRALSRIQNVLNPEGVIPLLYQMERSLTTNLGARADHRRELSGSIDSPAYLQPDMALSALLPELRTTISVLEGSDWSPLPIYSEYTPGAKNVIDDALLAIKRAIDLRHSMLSRNQQAAGSGGDSNWMSIVANTSSQIAPVGRALISPQVADRLAQQASSMQTLALSLGKLFGVPQAELQHFISAGTDNTVTAAAGTTASRRSQVKTLFAQLSQHTRHRGFLSSEGKQEVQEGLRKCSNLDVPALGPRAEHMVRSYELAILVPIVVFVDQHLNKYYHRIVPETSTVFPSRLTVRPLAAWINLVYLLILILLLRWIFS